MKPVVLKKTLFKLGFPHDQFENIEGKISILLNYRNKIAHGELRDGIKEEDYDKLRNAVFDVMNEVKHNVMKALNDKLYLRTTC